MQSEYAKLLEETLGTGSSNSRILAFKNKVRLLFIADSTEQYVTAFRKEEMRLPLAAKGNRQLEGCHDAGTCASGGARQPSCIPLHSKCR